MPNEIFPNPVDEDSLSRDPWELVAAEPTNLIALWPGDQFPTREEVLAALRVQHGTIEVVQDIDPQDPSIPWAMAVTSDGTGSTEPIVLWCEPARALPPGELNDPRAEACKWLLGLESVLDQADPLTSYVSLVRFLFSPFPDLPGLLDANTTGWMSRDALEEFFLEEGSQAPAETLWIIHVVRDESKDRGSIWLHTHGLWRCGRPELEMLDVDRAHLHEASSLLNDLAERLIDETPPPPGEPYLIGQELLVMLRPWQEVVARLPPEAPGGTRDRQEKNDNMHLGARAVVCDVQPDSEDGRINSYPREVLERLAEDDVVLYKSAASTERMTRRACYTWGELATAFAKLQPLGRGTTEEPRVKVLLKVSFAFGGGEEEDRSAEHLWFETLRFEGDRAEGRLLNSPLHIMEMEKDQVLWVERNKVSDWKVHTELGSFGPNHVTSMWRAIDEITREGQLK